MCVYVYIYGIYLFIHVYICLDCTEIAKYSGEGPYCPDSDQILNLAATCTLNLTSGTLNLEAPPPHHTSKALCGSGTNPGADGEDGEGVRPGP